MHKQNLVIGAGISGATIARLIAENLNEKVIVADIKGHIGGNCYDYRDENGIMIHKYGTHIFHTNNDAVWQFLSRFTKFNTYMHEVVALVDGIKASIPFNFNTLYQVFPTSLAKRLEEKLLSKYTYNTKVPILDFIQQDDADLIFLGQYIYDKVFLNYTVKQWGLDPESVASSVTARVPVYLSKDNRYFQDKYQGIPQEGYTQMIKNILNHENIEIMLNTNYKDITEKFDRTICTSSIDEYFDYRFGVLPYRSVNFSLETHEKEFYQSHCCVNYPNNYDFTRIHEYKHLLNDCSEKTVIAKEFSEPFELGRNDRYYPIDNKETREKYTQYLALAAETKNLFMLGRLGDYKYYNMDNAVERAISLFKEISYA